MRLKTSFRTLAAPDVAFSYLRDFGRIEEWDPFIASANRLTPGEPRVGSAYLLKARRGRLTLHYEVVELDDQARRIRLVGSATGFRGWDEISVTPTEAVGSIVRYEAEIGLHGRGRLLYLFAPVILVAFAIPGRNPIRGLHRGTSTTSLRLPDRSERRAVGENSPKAS